MHPILAAVIHARGLVENDVVGLTAPARAALRDLVDFACAANPPPAEENPQATASHHCVYMHPSNPRAIFFEPGDPWTPYYEWVRADDAGPTGWKLVNRHCWRADALLIVAGKALAPPSSRPPPPAVSGCQSVSPPRGVEIMSLEDQVRQVLSLARDAGRYHGLLAEGVRALERAGFNLDQDEVKDALYRVSRGTSFRLEAPSLRQESA